jgi:hypothetical protein
LRDRSPKPIQGVSRRTQQAIDSLAGGVGATLDQYRQFLRRPGRWLGVDESPVYARDDLERVLTILPPRARAELRRIVAPLDDEFWRRTLPDPHASADVPWWHRRLPD